MSEQILNNLSTNPPKEILDYIDTNDIELVLLDKHNFNHFDMREFFEYTQSFDEPFDIIIKLDEFIEKFNKNYLQEIYDDGITVYDKYVDNDLWKEHKIPIIAELYLLLQKPELLAIARS